MGHLGQFAKLVLADNLEVLGLPKQGDVGLEEYLGAL